MKNKFILLVFCSVLILSCDEEYLDPFSILEPNVVGTEENLIDLVNGLQRRVSTDRAGALYTTVNTSGLNTKELRLLNPGNLGENEILLGGANVSGDNEVLSNMWGQLMLTRAEATLVIDNVDNVASSTSRANTIKAYALFYRALSHGMLIQYFEQVPLSIGLNTEFDERAAVLQSVIVDLNQAVELASNGDDAIASELLSTFNIQDVTNALLARHQLMSGDYNAALSSAAQASLTSRNIWQFEDAFPNPLAFWFSSTNVAQARDQNFGLPDDLLPDPADARVAFHTSIANPGESPVDYRVRGFYQTNTSEIPIYLPGEMLLIQAEANARLGNIDDAVNFLDQVLTKTETADIYGLGANLPTYSGAMDQASVLEEIYRNRRIELYLTGLAAEDTKRFERPDTEFSRRYYPYPNDERDNNSNTPPNPSI